MNIKVKDKNKNLVNKTPLMVVFFVVIFILLVIHSILLIYPFIWLFLNSLKSSFEYYFNGSISLPKNWLFSNYVEVFTVFTDSNGNTYFNMIFNTLWWTFLTSVPGMFVCCMVAYVVAKFEFPGRKIVWGAIMAIMILPLYGSGAAAYKQTFTLGIYDSPLLVIKSWGGYGGFQFLMLNAFFSGLPKDYMDAAEIDGAGYFRTFLTIMIPLAIGPITALFVSSFVGCWNEYMTHIIYLPSYPTLASSLFVFQKKMIQGSNIVIYYCGAIIVAIPTIIVFSCFQNVFLNNMSIGGLKG